MPTMTSKTKSYWKFTKVIFKALPRKPSEIATRYTSENYAHSSEPIMCGGKERHVSPWITFWHARRGGCSRMESEVGEHLSSEEKFNEGQVFYLIVATLQTTLEPQFLPTQKHDPLHRWNLTLWVQILNQRFQDSRGDAVKLLAHEVLVKSLRIWSRCTEENKYSEENDNFDFKLVVFHDLCDRANIPEEVKVKAYPTRLRGLTLAHYYTNLRSTRQSLSLDQVCGATRN